MLRLVGGRFGPVLRTGPVFGTEPDDSVAEALHWEDEMQAGGPALPALTAEHTGAKRRAGRFRRDEAPAPAPPRTVQH